MEKSDPQINIFQILIFLKSEILYIYICIYVHIYVYGKINHLAWNKVLLY